MLQHLPESRAHRARRPGGTAVSMLLHTLVVAALVRATANATVAHFEKPEEVPLTITAIETPPPPSPPIGEQALRDLRAPQAPDIAVPALVPPINIPTVLPDIDYARSPIALEDFERGGRRQPGGAPGGVPGGTGRGLGGEAVYNEWEVERMAAAVPGGRGPEYPSLLRDAGVEGLVVVQFVVDTLGRADLNSLTVVRSDHAFFTTAVKRALAAMHFLPAEVGGRKVPQRVVQPFQFRLDR